MSKVERMDLEDLKEGIIISAERWPEPVEIEKVQLIGTDYIKIIGFTIHSNKSIHEIVNIEDIVTFSVETLQAQFTSPPSQTFLALEAKRYRYASLYDPLLAVSISEIDPLPHQIEAVYGYVLKLPRIRFLIADDPGAGKTIMAGLIIKELKLRKLVKRVLIVVPGHLKDQWRRELKERFEEPFIVIDRNVIHAHFGENVWLKEYQIITSMDFAKRSEILQTLEGVHFDLVIVDEAHKMSAYKYGDKTQKTARYRLGEVLSKISTHLLFLTATPHKGDPENFRLLLDLLEPGFFATKEMLEESIKNKDNPLFIRRIKEDLRDFDGKPLFLPRHVKTKAFRLSDAEKDLYNEVSRYVQEQYNKALTKDKRRNIAFALVILQRRLASSTYALLRSLERRRDRLKKMLSTAEARMQPQLFKEIDWEILEDLSEEERWKEEEIWETLSVAENRDELRKEIKILEKLIIMAKEVIQSESEVKLTALKETLDLLKKSHPNEKILIFTESRDTLEYLAKKLRTWGYTVNHIHGRMSLEERIRAEKIFKTETQILVATEAAGEGINLQFCHLMINYDIPWNPNRLEQRMGRIHRYGQTKEVFVFNLVAEDTREGRVLKKLFDKLEEIKEALGSDKVFDVISDVIYGKKLAQLLLDAAANARNINDILKDIDIKVDEEYIRRIKENLGESLATSYIDYTRIQEMAQKAREYRLIPEYTEAFFLKAFKLLGGKVRKKKDGFLAIDRVPYVLRQLSEADDFKRSYGFLQPKYPKVTFDKNVAMQTSDAEFVSFGHPLFESLLRYIEHSYTKDLQQGAVFLDPDGKLEGYILFFEGEIKDGLNNTVGKRLFALYIDRDMDTIQTIPPHIIWDLAETKVPNEPTTKEEVIDVEEPIEIEKIKDLALGTVVAELEKYLKIKEEERAQESAIKEKYGVKSLEFLINKLDADLVELLSRKERGEQVDLPIHNKEEQKRRYEKALKELKKEIVLEKTLRMNMPQFIGIIRVKPIQETLDTTMSSDEEIEKIGMQVAMEYERQHGRIPEDVSQEKLGFDIRSEDKNGRIRYIEVKARAHLGDVILTQNEWFKAQRFGADYYLYVVLNAATQPELKIVQNPATTLQPTEKVKIVRYVIPLNQIWKES